MLSQIYPTMIEIAGLFGDVPHEGHLTGVETMFADPKVMDMIGGVREPAAAKAFIGRERAHWREHHFGLWLFRDLETGRFAGWGGLRHSEVGGERVVELAYALTPENWGQGRASEIGRIAVQLGFENLGLREVAAFTRATNRRSEAVMVRVGMRYDRALDHAGRPHVLYRIAPPGLDQAPL
jgi:RimJ/RimL family protein N-acetyltransferase